MRGLIYKDFSIFCKCTAKRLLLVALFFTALLIYSGGMYGGLMASILFAMTIGIQNVLGITQDDKARWQKYQMSLPLSDFTVVAGKYLSVVCTLGFSLLGSAGFNLLSSVIFHTFEPAVWGLSFFAAVFLPLFWTGICLPLTYWFGVQSAQVMGLFVVIPVFLAVRHFEDGPGFSVMTDSILPWLLIAGAAAAVFILSFFISVMGYARRK